MRGSDVAGCRGRCEIRVEVAKLTMLPLAVEAAFPFLQLYDRSILLKNCIPKIVQSCTTAPRYILFKCFLGSI